MTHVEVFICLDILGPGGFADPNSPHPALSLAGGAIADFLPHLASLAHLFVGAHRTAQTVWTKRKPSLLPFDEFRALVDAERGTAALAFSASSQPDAFWLRVYGERMQASRQSVRNEAHLRRSAASAEAATAFFQRPGRRKDNPARALATLLRKFRGPGAYEGLWELLARTYRAFADGGAPPVTASQVLDVNRLVDALKPMEPRP